MSKPLALKLAPNSLCDVIGQRHLIGKDKILTNLVKNKKLFKIFDYEFYLSKEYETKVTKKKYSEEEALKELEKQYKKNKPDLPEELCYLTGKYREILIDSPTGSGKTIILLEYIDRFLSLYKDYVIVWLTPR